MKILPGLNGRLSRFSDLLSILSVIWTTVQCTAVFAGQARLSIETPRGGEFFVVGQQQYVRVASRLKSVDVALSRDGGQTFENLGTISATATDLTKRNSLAWTVAGPASNACVIRISSGVFSISSGMFVISAAPPTTGSSGGTGGSSGGGAVSGAPGSVGTFQLADGSVTTPKLADGAVTSPKISSGQASAALVLTADGSGGANWLNLPPADAIAPTAGTDLITAINNAATIGTVNASRLDPNLAVKNGPNTFTTGTQTLKTGADSTVGVVVKGNSPTQSADLLQWQDSTGVVKAAVSASGVISGNGSSLTNLNATQLTSGTVPVAQLPIAGIAAGTRGSVYADNATIIVGADGRITAIGAAPSGFAGGDLSGSYPFPAVATGAITTSKIANGAITDATVSDVAWGKITGVPSNTVNAVENKGGTPSVQSGTEAALPAAGTAGRLYVAADTLKLFRDNGASWDLVNPALTGDVTKPAGSNTTTIAASAVTTAKLANANVTAAKLANGSVDLASATVTGTVPFANGGTGATTQQSALNALAGGVASGKFLRGDGTNVTLSAIQASDVPTLNQNTTGTAANVTGTVAVSNGGTGATSLGTSKQPLLGNGTGAVTAAAAPTTTDALADMILGTSATTQKGIVVQGRASQTANLQEWQDASGAVKAAVSPAGVISGNGSGLTALDSSNLTTGTVPVARLPIAGTTPATAGAVYADNTSISVAADGKISAVASGVTLGGDVGGAANNNTIVAGAVTGSKIAASTITGGNLAGNISINTTGNIATTGSGTLSSAGGLTVSGGSVALPNNSVADAALSTNVPLKNAANTFTTGAQTIQTGADANKGLIIKGNSGSQSANLQEFQDHTGVTLSAIDKSGNFTGNAATATTSTTAGNVSGTVAVANGGTGATTIGGARTNLGAAASGANADITSLTGLTTALPVTEGGTGSTSLGTSKQPLLGNGAGAVTAAAAPTTADALADAVIGTSATTQKGLVVQGQASQTANLQEWQDSTGAVKASVSATGVISNSVGGGGYISANFNTTTDNVFGIGTTSFASRSALSLSGNGGWKGWMIIQNSADGKLSFTQNSGNINAGSPSLVMDTNQNVGVATSAPVDRLSIGAAPTAGATRALVNLSNTPLVGGNANGTYIGGNPASASADFMNYQVGGASKFKVDAAGILTASGFNSTGDLLPATDNSYKLGTTTKRWLSLDAGPTGLGVHNDATNTNKISLAFSGSTAQLATDAATPLAITTGANTGLNLNTTGYVGIGTANPLSSLMVLQPGVTQATPTLAGINPTYAGKTVLLEGDSAAYFVGRAVSNSLEFIMGCSSSGYAFSGTLTNHNYALRTANTDRVMITSTGVGINSATPNGKLDVIGTPTASANYGLVNIGSATTAFDGSTAGFFAGSANGTQLAVNAASGFTGNLLDLQLGGSSKFKIASDGSFASPGTGTSTVGALNISGFGSLYSNSVLNLGAGSSGQVKLFPMQAVNTSSAVDGILAAGNFAPTSGTGVYNTLTLNPTINQTGGSTGVSRGIYITPVLTSAADFRAIETRQGNVIFGTVSGNVGIGTTAPTRALGLGGGSAQNIGMERTAGGSGNALTLNAGGAQSGATDQSGGNLILAGGVSTGAGSASILIQPVAAGASGSGDNAPATKVTIASNSTQFQHQYYANRFDNGTCSSGTATVDFNRGNTQAITLGANCTFTFTNAQLGARYLVEIIQDGTGSRTATWPANVRFSGGGSPTLTTTAGYKDILTLYYDGTNLNCALAYAFAP